jgi:hypothetical protein
VTSIRRGAPTSEGIYRLVKDRMTAGSGAQGLPLMPLRLVDRTTADVDALGAVASQLDPSQRRPKLAADVELKLFRVRSGSDYAMIANPRELVHLRLDPDEYEIAQLMDGTRSPADIVVERLQDSGSLDLEAVAEFEQTLDEGGFPLGQGRSGPPRDRRECEGFQSLD